MAFKQVAAPVAEPPNGPVKDCLALFMIMIFKLVKAKYTAYQNINNSVQSQYIKC